MMIWMVVCCGMVVHAIWDGVENEVPVYSEDQGRERTGGGVRLRMRG